MARTRLETGGRAGRTTRRAILQAAGATALAVAGAGSRAIPLSAAGAQESDREGTIRIYPAHGTWTASPHTEISFRGITRDELGSVLVTGSISGGHAGILSDHADGEGVSYLPDAHFIPGELVTVRADGVTDPDGDGHVFGVAQPVPWVATPAERDTENPEVPPRQFRSRPDLRPPVMEITTPPTDETAPGRIMLAPKVVNGQNGAMILDEDGELVWFGLPAVETSQINDLKVQEYQGQPVLTWNEFASPIGFGLGHFVIADTSYRRIAEIQVGNGFAGGDHHELLITPRNTALFILYHSIEWDLSEIGGPKHGLVIDNIVQEVEIETGRVLFEWHTLDHIPVHESRLAFNPADNRDHPFDYFHMNSIEEDPDGNLIISARHTFAIYKIDRLSGAILWRLHGERSDFEMGEGAEFAWQHDARVHPNGELSLFDNHEASQDLEGESWSRGLVLQLDEAAMTAEVVREYIHPDRFIAVSQGNMQILPNGNVFIGWGSAPVFSEFTPDGELVFDGRFPAGGNSYRAYRFPWVGQPVDPPDVAVEATADGVTIHASWNGATEVASWQALAGSTPESMAPAGDPVPRDGFETAISVDAGAAWYGVQALDVDGSVLGASEPVELQSSATPQA